MQRSRRELEAYLRSFGAVRVGADGAALALEAEPAEAQRADVFGDFGRLLPAQARRVPGEAALRAVDEALGLARAQVLLHAAAAEAADRDRPRERLRLLLRRRRGCCRWRGRRRRDRHRRGGRGARALACVRRRRWRERLPRALSLQAEHRAVALCTSRDKPRRHNTPCRKAYATQVRVTTLARMPHE